MRPGLQGGTGLCYKPAPIPGPVGAAPLPMKDPHALGEAKSRPGQQAGRHWRMRKNWIREVSPGPQPYPHGPHPALTNSGLMRPR